MAYDQALAERVRKTIAGKTGWVAKEMFGGIGFMLHGNMAYGVIDDGLIVRVGPDSYESSLEEAHTRIFDMTGRPMRGWVVVDPQGLSKEGDLHTWVQRGSDYHDNPASEISHESHGGMSLLASSPTPKTRLIYQPPSPATH